jgi:transcriptional regulator NrdR family protein
MDMALAKERLRDRKCPYCGADRKNLVYVNLENDGKEVSQSVDCTACEKHFTEVYSFHRVIITDYPGEDFRIDFND